MKQAASSSVVITNKKTGYSKDSYSVATHYDENINMYNEPPQNIISLHEFSKIALNRLQVLKKIEFM